MVLNNKWVLTFMLSTIFVLSIHSQYFIQRILDDELRKGSVLSIQKNISSNEYYLDLGVFYNDIFGVRTLFYITDEESKKIKLKDFKDISQWSSVLGESIKFDGHNYYYSTCDYLRSNYYQDSVNWSFGKLDNNGNHIFEQKTFFKPVKGIKFFAYGLELVKNEEVILWGIGIPPERDPLINDPYILWVRLRKDGTLISGPNYYKPPAVTTWAQPTDATLDIDSMMVMVYDSKNGGKDKYVLKIREDDTIENMVYMPLGHTGSAEEAKLCVTKDGHFMVVNYDPQKYEERFLTRVNRDNEVVWQKSFDLPMGIVYGFLFQNVSLIRTNRIIEASNGDILMCGSIAVIDSFYMPKSNQKILTSNNASSYIARFSKDGELLWRHFLVDQNDDGTLNTLVINDIIETVDGSLVVGGSIGVKNDFDRSTPFYMKLGPNGCFDDRCSHVDKWWYFPEDIVSVSDPDRTDHKIVLYPNPGKDQVSILLPAIESNDVTYRYAVYDAKGQSHIQGVMQSDDPIIHTQFLPTGLYIITIRDSQGKISMGKWVKE